MRKLHSRPIIRTLACILCMAIAFATLLGASSQVVLPKNNQTEFGMLDAEGNGFMGEPDYTLDMLIIGDS